MRFMPGGTMIESVWVSGDADHAFFHRHLDEPRASAAVRAVAGDHRARAAFFGERDRFAHGARRDELPHAGVTFDQSGGGAGAARGDVRARVDRAVAQPRCVVRQAHDAVAVDAAQIRGDERFGDEARVGRGDAELLQARRGECLQARGRDGRFAHLANFRG